MKIIIECDCGNRITIDKDLDKYDLYEINDDKSIGFNIDCHIIWDGCMGCFDAVGAVFKVKCKQCNKDIEIENIN